MAFKLGLGSLLLALLATQSVAIRATDHDTAVLAANPIRKVVNMLKAMQKKVGEEAEKEKALYEKFMCYCTTSGGALQESIAAGEKKAPELGTAIDTAESQKVALQEELKAAQTDRSAAKAAQAEATAIREKEAAAFAAEKADYDANIAAMKKAVAALSKGMSGFLQTGEAQVLKRLVLAKTEMLDGDRQEVLAFLTGGQGSEYAPRSGEITGILKEMQEKMEKSLAAATASETDAVKAYEELMAAKAKEVAALTAAIESKTKRTGELAVEIVQMKADLSDTAAALREDKKFLAELEKGCTTKTSEWQEIVKTRAEELAALAETIKFLSDDDALELFKKTLPSAGSASMLQFAKSSAELARGRAMALLKAAMKAAGVHHGHYRYDLVELALRGKKVGFEKVIKMIDDMVEVLKGEQVDDDNKKEYCNTQLDTADDKKKDAARALEDEEAAIARATEGIATLTDEIAGLEAGIAALDKSVTAATEQRKEEHMAFTELMASDAAAKDILGVAKNRLNKFYNPKLYKKPKEAEPAEDEVFIEVSAHLKGKVAPPPPPATFDAYAKKGEEATGVIAMIDLLVKDLDKEMTQAETEEQDAQADYTAAMKDSADKRTTDSALLTEKVSMKASLEGELESHKDGKAAATKELAGLLKYIQNLHLECDWLLQYFEVRKEARASEMDSLAQAKAVLSGAGYSLMQSKLRGFVGRSL